MTHVELLEITSKSSFRKSSGGGVTIFLRTLEKLISSISLYTDYCDDEDFSVERFFEKAIPGFQRDNNKWTLQMQQKFVENVLKGFKTEIKLFRMDEEEDSQVIDGLQRLTAIVDFMQNKFTIFGTFYYKDLNFSEFGASIIVSIFKFNDWQEVANFYIDMNENITHSAEDIEKAKNWFERNYNISFHDDVVVKGDLESEINIIMSNAEERELAAIKEMFKV